MDYRYIAPTTLSTKTIATEQAFLEHAKKVLATLIKFYLIIGTKEASIQARQAALEALATIMVCSILFISHFLRN